MVILKFMWVDKITLDCSLRSLFPCSTLVIPSSRPAQADCRRAQRQSRMARSFSGHRRLVLDGCGHGGILIKVGATALQAQPQRENWPVRRPKLWAVTHPVFKRAMLFEGLDCTRTTPKTVKRLSTHLAVAIFENLCARMNWSFFCSGFVISAMRPEGEGRP